MLSGKLCAGSYQTEHADFSEVCPGFEKNSRVWEILLWMVVQTISWRVNIRFFMEKMVKEYLNTLINV